MAKKQDVTTTDIMKFLEDNMVTKAEFETRVGNIETRVGNIEMRVGNIEKNMVTKEVFDLRVGHLENQMVTKDYLDNKLADLGAEIGKRINRQAEKDKGFRKTLIDILSCKSILQGADIERLKEFV